MLRELAAEFLALAEKQALTAPLMIGHRIMGISLLYTGNIAQGRAHLDRAIRLYDPREHRPLATQFGQDPRAQALSYRSWALWLLGYPDAALADAEHALSDAREIKQAATLMNVLKYTSFTSVFRGDYMRVAAQANELSALVDEKGALYWNAVGMWMQGTLLRLTGNVSEAAPILNSGSLLGGQRVRRCLRRRNYPIWGKPMPTLANSMKLGAALTKQLPRWEHPMKLGLRPRSIVSLAK